MKLISLLLIGAIIATPATAEPFSTGPCVFSIFWCDVSPALQNNNERVVTDTVLVATKPVEPEPSKEECEYENYPRDGGWVPTWGLPNKDFTGRRDRSALAPTVAETVGPRNSSKRISGGAGGGSTASSGTSQAK